jgi:hypothetical protein
MRKHTLTTQRTLKKVVKRSMQWTSMEGKFSVNCTENGHVLLVKTCTLKSTAKCREGEKGGWG